MLLFSTHTVSDKAILVSTTSVVSKKVSKSFIKVTSVSFEHIQIVI